MRSRAARHYLGLVLFLAILPLAGSVIPSQASELGHFAPTLPRIRDFILPDPGFYFVLYNLYYTSDELKDKDGDSIDSISIGPLDFTVDTDVDSFMMVPTLIFASDFRILGGRWAALVAQPFGNASFQVAVESTTLPGFGLEVDESSWGLGETYIRPLWLGWDLGRFDVGA